MNFNAVINDVSTLDGVVMEIKIAICGKMREAAVIPFSLFWFLTHFVFCRVYLQSVPMC